MLQAYTSTAVEVEVADFVRGGTRYKQKVINTGIEITSNADGTLSVRQPLQIQAYAATEQGGYGERLPHADRSDVLVSADSRAVDPATGAIRYQRITSVSAFNTATQQAEEIPLPENGGEGWRAYLVAKPEPLMLQGQFLALLHDTQPVNLRALREQYIRDADAPPSRFA